MCVLPSLSGIAQERPANAKKIDANITERLVVESLQVDFTLGFPALGLSTGFGGPEGGRRFCLLLEPKHGHSKDFVGKYGDSYGTVKSQAIDRLSDLRDKVHITSPEAALSFVRMPTSPLIFRLLNRREKPGYLELEVVCKETDLSKIAFGLHGRFPYPTLDNALTFPEGKYALLSAAMAKTLGINFAQVKPSGEGYSIERTLLVEEIASTRIYLIKTVEWVGANGEYRTEKNEKIVAPAKPAVMWSLPGLAYTCLL